MAENLQRDVDILVDSDSDTSPSEASEASKNSFHIINLNQVERIYGTQYIWITKSLKGPFFVFCTMRSEHIKTAASC